MRCCNYGFMDCQACGKGKNRMVRLLFCILAITILLLSGCGKQSKDAIVISGNRITERQIMYVLTKSYTVVDWKPLCIGGALAVCKASESGDELRFYLCSRDEKMLYTQEIYYVTNVPTVRIFYEEDWQERIRNHLSEYVVVEANGKADLLVFVMQNYDLEEKTAYPDSPMYGIEPSDTLGTEPLMYHDPGWYQDYPMWIFEIPLDHIDETYALTYGDFVLTGEDIMNHTWQIGDAPIMK